MQKEILGFYSALRQIFIFCPSCESIHRVSDCKIYQKSKPNADWKEKIDNEILRLERMEEKLEEKIELAREAARLQGRKNADKEIRKVDTLFAPLKLNSNDSKVVFHPVDFIVFHGMNSNEGDCSIKQIILLDKIKTGPGLDVQRSIEKAVQAKNYEWITLRVKNDGEIVEE